MTVLKKDDKLPTMSVHPAMILGRRTYDVDALREATTRGTQIFRV